MTQITFTSDVREVSTDSNLDGSIRWFVYERDSLTNPGEKGIYVRRQVSSSALEPEIQIVNIGTNPKIYFLVNQWILLFNFKNRLAKISHEEGVIPSLTSILFNQSGNAGDFCSLTHLAVPTRIVFQSEASSSASLSTFARMPAVGVASSTASLTTSAETPPAFMGTNGVPGSASLSGFILSNTTNVVVKSEAESTSQLVGRAPVLFATASASVFLGADSTHLVKVHATANSSSSLSHEIFDSGVTP